MAEQKPSAEIQAVVMNLWNAIRETAQSTSAVHAERQAMQSRIETVKENLQQEIQSSAKLQAYSEHLEAELKQVQQNFATLQQLHAELHQTSLHRDETLRELRGILNNHEEHLAEREQELTLTKKELDEVHGHDILQEQEIADLRAELAASNDRAMLAAADLGNLQPRYIALEMERDTLAKTLGELSWRLTALEEQTARDAAERDAAEYDRVIAETHARTEEVLRTQKAIEAAASEEIQRFTAETDERIAVLTSEREMMQERLSQIEQASANLQQTADEQARTIRIQEQTITNLHQIQDGFRNDEQEFEHRLEQERISHRNAILARERIHGELELRNQMLDATDERFGEYEEHIRVLVEQNAALSVQLASERGRGFTDMERELLTTNIEQFLQRVESVLAETETMEFVSTNF
jgi:hypothetical protein